MVGDSRNTVFPSGRGKFVRDVGGIRGTQRLEIKKVFHLLKGPLSPSIYLCMCKITNTTVQYSSSLFSPLPFRHTSCSRNNLMCILLLPLSLPLVPFISLSQLYLNREWVVTYTVTMISQKDLQGIRGLLVIQGLTEVRGERHVCTGRTGTRVLSVDRSLQVYIVE